MACDTFLKIVQKCKRKFVIVQVTFALEFSNFSWCWKPCLFLVRWPMCFYLALCSPHALAQRRGGGGVETYYTLMICISYSQVGENEPFVSELLTGLPTTIADLEPHQIHTFYESVCILYVLTKSVNRGFMLNFTVSFYFLFSGWSHDTSGIWSPEAGWIPSEVDGAPKSGLFWFGICLSNSLSCTHTQIHSYNLHKMSS